MIDRLLATLRRWLPVADLSERQQWRADMDRQIVASKHEIERLHRVRRAHGPIEDAIFPDTGHRRGDRQ